MWQYIKKGGQILGMNARNLKYIRPSNLKKSIRIADDKMLSKRLLKKGDIPVPKLIAKVRNHEELENFDWTKLPNGFALKPNKGLGGEGILVVYGKKKGRLDAWVKADGTMVTVEDLKSHIRGILDGNFSLSEIPDTAFFEERVQLLKLFKPYSYKGIPDIRVIVYNKVPVMAMLRVATKESGGKANLQQGAIGVGIDLATGVTTTAVQGKSKLVEYVPGSRLLLSGIKIPYWKEILELAVKAQEVSGLGFLGADVTIDKERGPVFLELNARPGLSIQIANLAGLKKRLERVDGLNIKTIKRGVKVGMNLFGGEIEEELEEISGQRVIGTTEKVMLFGRNDKEIEVDAKIDTGAFSTSIDMELAKKIGFGKVVEEFNRVDLSEFDLVPEKESETKKIFMSKYGKNIKGLEDVAVIFSSSGSSIRPVVKASFIMDQKKVTAKINIADRSNLVYPMIIGKRNLGKFLIDVNKK